MKTFKKQIEEMKVSPQSDYENNVLIWEALEKLADANQNRTEEGWLR